MEGIKRFNCNIHKTYNPLQDYMVEAILIKIFEKINRCEINNQTIFSKPFNYKIEWNADNSPYMVVESVSIHGYSPIDKERLVSYKGKK